MTSEIFAMKKVLQFAGYHVMPADEYNAMNAEIERLHRDYAIFEEMAPLDLPRDMFARACFASWAVRPNNAVHLTPAAVGSRDDNDMEPQAQVTADR